MVCSCNNDTCESQMISQCLEYASAARRAGGKIVGIMCEFAPREIIMAADAIPICLCGGSQDTIATAEKSLPAGLCPLIKSTFGYHAEKSNPFLEMADLVVAETTCDGKKKMFELMSETRPMHIMDLPQQPDSPVAKNQWRQQCEKLKSELEQRFNVSITAEKLKAAISQMNRQRKLRRELAFLMARKKPAFTGRELLGYNSIIACLPWALERCEKAIEKYSACCGCDELSGRVRVLLTGVPMVHGAERIVELIESNGGLVVAQENCTGLKPLLDDVEIKSDGDIINTIADKYLALPCSVMSPNIARMKLLRTLAEKFSPDCVIDLSWQGCLTYDVESYYVRRFADDMELPFLKIQTDYSPCDSARLVVRIEALMESAQRRKK